MRCRFRLPKAPIGEEAIADVRAERVPFGRLEEVSTRHSRPPVRSRSTGEQIARAGVATEHGGRQLDGIPDARSEDVLARPALQLEKGRTSIRPAKHDIDEPQANPAMRVAECIGAERRRLLESA